MFMSKFSCMALYYHMYDKQTNGLSVTKLDSIDQFYNRNFRNYLDNVSTSNIRYYGKLWKNQIDSHFVNILSASAAFSDVLVYPSNPVQVWFFRV